MKKLFAICCVLLVLACVQSCTKDPAIAFDTGTNPMPGKWHALNTDFDGYPVDFEVTIYDKFDGDKDIYASNDSPVGELAGYYEGETYKSGEVLSCIYNSRTFTGKFIVHYDDDDPDVDRTIMFLYDRVEDCFTIIEMNYSITFSRD